MTAHTSKPGCLVSVHDVMPETLPEIERILAFLETSDVWPVTLLVVPGRDWSQAQLAQLRRWAKRGYVFAAHGWKHEIDGFGGLFHRLHSRLLSRRVAEHLSLRSSSAVRELMLRSLAWFAANDLPSPTLYVPPAWALGYLITRDRSDLPFRWIEVTRGFLDPKSGGVTSLPLTGFEADTAPRAAFLRSWNALQVRRARRTRQPLRVSLHPPDLDARIAEQISKILHLGWHYLDHDAVSPR